MVEVIIIPTKFTKAFFSSGLFFSFQSGFYERGGFMYTDNSARMKNFKQTIFIAYYVLLTYLCHIDIDFFFWEYNSGKVSWKEDFNLTIGFNGGER